MKKIMFVCAIAMAACGGGNKKPETTNTTTTDPNTSTSNTDGTGTAANTGEGVECAKEIALVCPDGQIDGCLKTPVEGDTHKCVAK
jgi:hypothetical protein